MGDENNDDLGERLKKANNRLDVTMRNWSALNKLETVGDPSDLRVPASRVAVVTISADVPLECLGDFLVAIQKTEQYANVVELLAIKTSLRARK